MLTKSGRLATSYASSEVFFYTARFEGCNFWAEVGSEGGLFFWSREDAGVAFDGVSKFLTVGLEIGCLPIAESDSPFLMTRCYPYCPARYAFLEVGPLLFTPYCLPRAYYCNYC